MKKDRAGSRGSSGGAVIAMILLVGFFLPIGLVHLTAKPPVKKRIHVDLFRYGMVPSIIHASRGDTLVLTFSSRDTPQSFFLQEYDIDVKVSPNTGEVEVVHPSDPDGEPEAMREVEFVVGRRDLAGFLNTKSRYRGHVFSGPLHGFEQGFLVVHPNYLHAGMTGLLLAIPLAGFWSLRSRRRSGEDRSEHSEQEMKRSAIDLFERWPWLHRIAGIQGLQFWLMSLMSILMYVILLTSLVGTKMAGGNLGVLLLWVVWLVALIVLLVPFFGRIWCTICPLPMLGDALQRGSTVGVRTGKSGIYNNRFNGWMRRWPRRLANAVPRTIVFLCFGTVSVLVISQPRWTGWALILLIAMGTSLALVFEHRSFCRFLCPINSFLSLYSRMGRLSLRARHRKSCDACIQQDAITCERGNEFGWACPYGLAVHEVEENAECGLCMECIRSCRYRNISLFWRPFRLDRLLRGRDEAMQAIVMMTLGVTYCILFQGPWYGLRDMVDLVDKKNWDLFALYAAGLWLIALVLLPLLIRILTDLGAKLARVGQQETDLYPRNVSPLVPFGLFIWIAFAIPMLQVQGSFILSTLSDPFGWGWNLFGTAGHPWIQYWPEAIPWIQSVALLIGFAIALKTAHRVWTDAIGSKREAVLGMLPISTFLLAVSSGMLWFFTG